MERARSALGFHRLNRGRSAASRPGLWIGRGRSLGAVPRGQAPGPHIAHARPHGLTTTRSGPSGKRSREYSRSALLRLADTIFVLARPRRQPHSAPPSSSILPLLTSTGALATPPTALLRR